MKIMVLSDFHGAEECLPALSSAMASQRPDVLCFCGDVVKGYARGDEWLEARRVGREPDRQKAEIAAEEAEDLRLYQAFYDAIAAAGVPTMAVPGNMDAPESRFFAGALNRTLAMPNVDVVHGAWQAFGDFVFAGYGGEITEAEREDFFVLQCARHEVEFALRALPHISRPKVLVMHTPPVGQLGLDDGKQKGSAVVNDLIERCRPAFVFCGHAHKAQGQEQMGSALVVNPGALKDGRFALVDTDSRSVDFARLD